MKEEEKPEDVAKIGHDAEEGVMEGNVASKEKDKV